MDEDVEQLGRVWSSTGAPVDGLAYFKALSRRGPLPCPSCGSRDTLEDLFRRVPSPIDDILLVSTGPLPGPCPAPAATCAVCGLSYTPTANLVAIQHLLREVVPYTPDPAPPTRAAVALCGKSMTCWRRNARGWRVEECDGAETCTSPVGHGGECICCLPF